MHKGCVADADGLPSNYLMLSPALMHENKKGFLPAPVTPFPLGVYAGRTRVLCRGGPRQGAVLLPYRGALGPPALQRHVWRGPGLPEAGVDGVGGGFWCVGRRSKGRTLSPLWGPGNQSAKSVSCGRDNGSVDGGTRTPKGRCNPASVSCCPDNSLRQE